MPWGRVFKWVIYIVPIVAFAFLLNMAGPLKRPMGKNDDLPGSFNGMETAVLTDDWSAAAAQWERAHVAMNSVSRRVELSAERQQLQEMYVELARLRGSIQAEERPTALEHISVLKALFQELGT